MIAVLVEPYMLRFLVVVPLLVGLPQRVGEEARPTTLRHFVDHQFEAALRVSDVVKIRFLVARAAAPCRHVDNLFGYNLLLSYFTDKQQAMIATAAHEGWEQGGRTAAAEENAGDCTVKLRGLQAADDELVVLSEQVASGTARP